MRPAGCRRRRRSFGDAAVILVPAATIQTYTYIYMQYMQIHADTGTYMHAPITVGRGLWGAVADAVCLRERRNFPNRLGWGLGPGRQARIWPGTPTSRTGGAVQGPPTGEEGGVREIELSKGTGMEEKSVCAHDLGCPE